MIIPIRCFTCGNVIADKWQPFIKLTTEKKNVSTENVNSELDIEYIKLTDDGSIKKSIEGEALDELLDALIVQDRLLKLTANDL